MNLIKGSRGPWQSVTCLHSLETENWDLKGHLPASPWMSPQCGYGASSGLTQCDLNDYRVKVQTLTALVAQAKAGMEGLTGRPPSAPLLLE